MPIRAKAETVLLKALRDALDGQCLGPADARRLIAELDGVDYRIIGPRVGIGGQGAGSGVTTKALKDARAGGNAGKRALAKQYGWEEDLRMLFPPSP